MRHIILAAVLALVAAAAADPIEGLWQTQPDEGAFAYVTIAPCGEAYCGTITRAFKGTQEYQSPNIERQIIIDMAPQGGGKYQGQVWRPSNDKVYAGKAIMSGTQMSLSGCVAGGLLCKTQAWIKVQ